MKSRAALVVVASVLGFVSLALPAAAQRMPCAQDMQKLCKDIPVGGGAKMKCLQEHQAEVSDACKKHLEGLKDRRGHGPCRADVEKLCGSVTPGAGRIQLCLQQHEAELSPECKAQVSKAKSRRVP